MNLPIDHIPGTNPPKFKWKQTVVTLTGSHTSECEGMVQITIEKALLELIGLAKQQEKEIIGLQKQIEGHVTRIVNQSELLTRKSEVQPIRKK